MAGSEIDWKACQATLVESIQALGAKSPERKQGLGMEQVAAAALTLAQALEIVTRLKSDEAARA